MVSVKMTFSLDQDTADRLRDTAESLQKPKSQVVREAIHDYAERAGRLTEAEKRRMLIALDEMASTVSSRTEVEVDNELAGIRRARQAGGRATHPGATGQ
ncbi:MAG: ribbon-helix-helix protein, CopG family [Acidimicrobiia bacterium]|nr:ribbon-helix-helix protein, CopG family [Acidimicrobiia bacterium]